MKIYTKADLTNLRKGIGAERVRKKFEKVRVFESHEYSLLEISRTHDSNGYSLYTGESGSFGGFVFTR